MTTFVCYRASCRYYFINHVTGEKLWEFPSVGTASSPSTQDMADGEEEEVEIEEEEEEYDDDEEVMEPEAPPTDGETAALSFTKVECEEEQLPATTDVSQVTRETCPPQPDDHPVAVPQQPPIETIPASTAQYEQSPAVLGPQPPATVADLPIVQPPPQPLPIDPATVMQQPSVAAIPQPSVVQPAMVPPPGVPQSSLASLQQYSEASTDEEQSGKLKVGGFGYFGPKKVSPPSQPKMFGATDVQDKGAEDMDLDESSPEMERPAMPLEESQPRSSIPLYMSPPQSNESTPQPSEAPPTEAPPTEAPPPEPTSRQSLSLYDDDLPPTKDEEKDVISQEGPSVAQQPGLEEEEAQIRARLLEKIKSKEDGNTESSQEAGPEEEKLKETVEEEVKEKEGGQQAKESDKEEEEKDKSSSPEYKKSKKDKHRDDRKHYDDERDSHKSKRSKRHRDDYSDSDSDDYRSSSHKKHRRYRSRSPDRRSRDYYSSRSSNKSSRSRRYSDDYSDDDYYSRHRSRSRDRYKSSKKKKKEKKSRHRHRSSSSEDERSSRHESSRSKGKFRDRDTKSRDTSRKSTPPPMEKTFVPARFKPKKPQGDENGQQMLTPAQMEIMHNIASATGVYPVAYPIDAQQYANYAYYDPTQVATTPTTTGMVYSEPPPPPPPKADEKQQSSSDDVTGHVIDNASHVAGNDTGSTNSESQAETVAKVAPEPVQDKQESIVIEKSEESQTDSELNAVEKVALESEVPREITSDSKNTEAEGVPPVAHPPVPPPESEVVAMDTEAPDDVSVEQDASSKQVAQDASEATSMDVVASPPAPPPTLDALPSENQATPQVDNSTTSTDVVTTASSDPSIPAPPRDATPPLQEAGNYTYSAPSTTYAYQYTDPNQAYAAYAQAQAYYNPYTTTSAAAAVYDPNQYAAAMNYYAAYQAAYTAGYGAYFQQGGNNGTQKK